MKKTILIVSAAMMSLAACTNDEENIDNNLTNGGDLVYTATVDQSSSSRTNFTTDGSNAKGEFFWTTGDQIKVYNASGNSSKLDIKEGAGSTTATFSGTAPEGGAPTYAVYPYSEGGSLSGETLTISLPTSYEYSYAQTDYPNEMIEDLNSINLPMVAKIDDGATVLSFKNLAGVVCFKFTEVPATTSKIVFTSHTQISGDFEVDFSGENPTISTQSSIIDVRDINPDYMSVAVTFEPSDEVTTKVVYFPVPCGTYDRFRITMYDESGVGLAYMPSSTSLTVERSKALVYRQIKAIPIVAEAVDLGLSVKWASCNIGASKPEDFGSYFSWGETVTKSSYSYSGENIWYGLSSSDLKNIGVIDTNGYFNSNYDAASTIWGDNWLIPSVAEINELIEDTDSEWTTMNEVDGYKFKSKTNPENYIFIPASQSYGHLYSRAGDPLGAGCTALWSATALLDGSQAYGLFFNSHESFIYQEVFYEGLTIRPISE